MEYLEEGYHTDELLPKISRDKVHEIVLISRDKRLFKGDAKKIRQLLPDVKVTRYLIKPGERVNFSKTALLFMNCDMRLPGDVHAMRMWSLKQAIKEQEKFVLLTYNYSFASMRSNVTGDCTQMSWCLMQFDLCSDVRRLILYFYYRDREDEHYDIYNCHINRADYGLLCDHQKVTPFVRENYSDSESRQYNNNPFPRLFNKIFV
jgi:hypothetical protein